MAPGYLHTAVVVAPPFRSPPGSLPSSLCRTPQARSLPPLSVRSSQGLRGTFGAVPAPCLSLSLLLLTPVQVSECVGGPGQAMSGTAGAVGLCPERPLVDFGLAAMMSWAAGLVGDVS